MRKLNQNGALNLLLIPLILVSILFIVAVIFGFESYSQEQKYKTQTDQIVNTHVQAAVKNQQQIDEKNFIEEAKKPLTAYNGPADFGSLQIMYPKTWSVYVNNVGSNEPVDGYGYPGQVPGSNGGNSATAYALRFQINNTSYNQVLQQFQGQLQQKTVTITPYSPAKVPKVQGVRVDGAIEQNIQGSMIILPLRNMTLEIWTEAPQFLNDFNNNILPNFSFQP